MAPTDPKSKAKSEKPEFPEPTQARTFTGNEATSVVNFGAGSETKVSQRLVPILTITTGTEQGKVLSLNENKIFSMGRARDCDLTLHDSSCSRRHAEIFQGPQGELYIKDFNSTNGSKVNGKRITDNPVKLNNGDRIQLGDNTILRFSLVPEDDARAQMDVYFRATRDTLTGAFNRRIFEETLKRELAFHNRGGQGLGLIMLDIDFFKRINDSMGHPAGDEVLRELGRRIIPLIRKEDLFARVGGEEFALIIRNDSYTGAQAFAERLRESIQNSPVHFEDKSISITASVGLCYLESEDRNLSFEAFVQSSDEALYEAKKNGRNRSVFKKPSSGDVPQ